VTPQQAEEYISRKAAEYGVPPSEALSLWSQESGRSLDTGLKGAYLQRHNDRAVGPFQVVPKFHPKFPVGGSFQEQADYAIPFYASGGPTMEDRTRRYYGSGAPMKGQPTLAQYQGQMKSRMTGSPLNTEQMQDPPQQEPTMDQYPIEDPEDLARRTREAYADYVPQYQERVQYQDPYEGINMQPREVSGLEKWLTNPLTQGGIAMLAANSSDPLANIGYGLQVAGHAYGQRGQAENELVELQMKRAEARRKSRRETSLENRDIDKANQELYQRDQLLKYANSIERDKPHEAALIRAGITSGISAPTSFAPQIYKQGEKYYEVSFDNKGGRQVREVPEGMVPFNADIKSPERRAEIAYGESRAGEEGKGAAKLTNEQMNAAKNAGKLEQVLDESERLLKNATGSGLGALADQAAGFVGYGTEGSKANAQLEVAANQILMAVPRFEGPQSDKDTATYRQAAGDLANPSKPVAVRQAALETIRLLNKKAAERGYPPSQYAPSGTTPGAPPVRKRFNPQTGRIE
jgi:hypothetical protein